MRKILTAIKLLLGTYILCCILLYFFQECIIFHPEKLTTGHTFHFNQDFEEITIAAEDKTILHGVLFKADRSKGLIFYLHGNSGSINSWGNIVSRYTDLDYDVFMLDYRGYGKSEGKIQSQQQLFNDVQTAYNEMLLRYTEDRIIILGYSIGTGPASKLASTSNAQLLILQAPYYSLTDVMEKSFPIIPTFILRYRLETSSYLQHCRMPVIIFHGDHDEVIDFESSIKLKAEFKNGDQLVPLPGQGHNGITDHPDYIRELQKLLN